METHARFKSLSASVQSRWWLGLDIYSVYETSWYGGGISRRWVACDEVWCYETIVGSTIRGVNPRPYQRGREQMIRLPSVSVIDRDRPNMRDVCFGWCLTRNAVILYFGDDPLFWRQRHGRRQHRYVANNKGFVSDRLWTQSIHSNKHRCCILVGCIMVFYFRQKLCLYLVALNGFCKMIT